MGQMPHPSTVIKLFYRPCLCLFLSHKQCLHHTHLRLSCCVLVGAIQVVKLASQLSSTPSQSVSIVLFNVFTFLLYFISYCNVDYLTCQPFYSEKIPQFRKINWGLSKGPFEDVTLKPIVVSVRSHSSFASVVFHV